MQTTSGDYHPTRFQDLAVTVEFHCNSACTFCIVQEGMNRFKGVPFERFRAIVDENARSRRYGRVIFTGGEVTLERSLLDWIRCARDSGGFANIRIQTNGRRLADPAYARLLVDEGVNEYFVSIHGPDAALQDAISQRPGSFDEAVAGIDNVTGLGARVITNTVMCTTNVGRLAEIVDLVADHGVRRAELWNYLPMEDHADDRGLIAPLGSLMPSLRAALDRCRARGVEAVTKYVPYCLLGEHAGALDNGQADVIIVESFWNEFPRFNCLYEARCEHSEACLGLHHDYVNRFGWEEDRLQPTPRARPWPPGGQDRPLEGRPEEYDADGRRVAVAGDGGGFGHPAWEALVAGLPPQVGRLVRLQLTRNQARYRFRLVRGAEVEVVLGARNDAVEARARTRSFNVFYSPVEGEYAPVELDALLRVVAGLIARRDQGQISLDARKGLVQIVPPKRQRGAGATTTG